MTTVNPYKIFRGIQGISNVLSKRYDEPTYMTFRVLFGQNSAIWSGTNLLNTNYDRMPHPLFINQQTDSTKISGEGGRTVVEFNREIYSTIDFLRDSNEFTRAEMLKEFILVWKDLQTNFQWYFQSIEGIADLLRVTPERGKRVGQDIRLTFNMIEGIDQKISYLLNLYKKIAWDDLYQRWVLPDLMRFFDIQIFITEFRTFHQSIVEPNSNQPVYLQILNGILPTYLIECEMCEFDINSFNYSYRDKVSISDEPEMTSVSFKIKVGNVNEISTFPLFKHFIFDDKKLNGLERSKEMGLMKDLDGRVVNPTEVVSGIEIPKEIEFSSTKSGDLRYRNLDQKAQDTFFQEGHTSGNPYIESDPTNNLRNSSPNYSIDVNNVDPIDPATWIGNAITFGKSFGVNFITQKIDKAKMTNIPGLGFSFNEAISAIQSKDFTQVLALIRRAIAESVGGAEPPSALLDQKIDKTFREFLTGITLSEATDEDELELVKTANKVLSDGGKWEEVKDLSYATNLRGPGETNKLVKVIGKNEYKQQISVVTNNDRSKATNLDGEPIKTGKFIGDQTPSSATTANQRELEGKKYTGVTDRSKATDLDGEPNFINPSQIIEATPSSLLSKKIESQGPSLTVESKATNGDEIKAGNLKGNGGLSNVIEGKGLNITSIKSEATNEDNIGKKLAQPSSSKATNNKIENV